MSEMGKVLWHTVMSLDGFIAGRDDDMAWVSVSTAARVRQPRRS
jgi:hypothetical protein